MKSIGVAVLALAVLVQADRSNKLVPKDLLVTPLRAALFRFKIIYGREATPHQFPYQHLIIDEGSFCGGSILDENRILTTAHYIEGAKTVEVTVGTHQIQEVESEQQQVISNSFAIHPGWNLAEIANNIAFGSIILAVMEGMQE